MGAGLAIRALEGQHEICAPKLLVYATGAEITGMDDNIMLLTGIIIAFEIGMR